VLLLHGFDLESARSASNISRAREPLVLASAIHRRIFPAHREHLHPRLASEQPSAA